jgi:hypothetical protein
LFACLHGAVAIAGDLGEKPYLGWSSWSLQATKYPCYGGSWLSSENVRRQSDAMAAKLQRFGYTYVNVDSGWREGWDEFGRPKAHPGRFPEGIKELADYVHGKGQRLGIYYVPGIDEDLLKLNPPIEGTDRRIGDIVANPPRFAHAWKGGHAIDYSKPGAQEYIDSLARLFASWGVDFLKLDGVTPGSERYDADIDARGDVEAWSKALKNASRPIWLTLSWKLDVRFEAFWRRHSNALRISQDVESYDEKLTHWPQICWRFDAERLFASGAGAGRGWNDLDSLIVGNGEMSGLTPDERRSAMTLWAISCSPLYSGDDLEKLDDLGLEILTNEEVIAVQQSGNVARYLGNFGTGVEVWASYHPSGDVVLAVFNRNDQAHSGTVSLARIGIHENGLRIRDLWEHKDVGATAGDDLDVEIPPHSCKLFRFFNKENENPSQAHP